jgi:SAM-dependent methyltransferase
MFALLQMLHEHENRMKNKLGRPLEDLLILEIGPGQGRERARYFGLKNTVIGMDLDIIPQGLKPDNYLRMLRENGFGRFTKTIGRKLIIGRKNAKAWAKVVGSKEMPNPELIYGDICKAVPEPEAFDIVMSWSVFEHLPDPKQALENVIRSLKPGGIFYISLHLYTSNNGHHDIRAFTGGEDELPLWSHLRPSTSYLIEPSSYLNNWRLAQWRRLFSEVAPEYNEFLETYDCKEKYNSRLTESLRRELRDYSDEELFTVDAIYLWKKPN